MESAPREETGEREPRLECAWGKTEETDGQFHGRRLSPGPGKKAGTLTFCALGVCVAMLGSPARASPRALIPLPPAASLAPAVCAAEIRSRLGPARPR